VEYSQWARQWEGWIELRSEKPIAGISLIPDRSRKHKKQVDFLGSALNYGTLESKGLSEVVEFQSPRSQAIQCASCASAAVLCGTFRRESLRCNGVGRRRRSTEKMVVHPGPLSAAEETMESKSSWLVHTVPPGYQDCHGQSRPFSSLDVTNSGST
jgi:hypothetical protein